ncbi:MAG TPA: ComF family protein [Anaerolineales bacterium]
MWTGLDWLFPPACGGCGRVGSRWCTDCQARVSIICGIMCEVCGLPLERPGRCRTCELERPRFASLRAWAALQDPVQEALHKLKYRRDIGLGEALAYQIADFVRSLQWRCDLIVPVPLGQARFRERGYNQVGLIARPLALALGSKFTPRALLRRRETRSQVGLTRSQRRQNVRGAFEGIRELVSGRIVLLVDDVATTGSTLSSAAEALLAAEARDVFALTVARAIPRTNRLHA